MAWLILLGVLLIFLAGFLVLRIGIAVEYAEDGLKAIFFAGPFKIRLYPSRGKKKKKKAPKQKKTPKTEEELKKGGPVGKFKELLSVFSYVSGKLKRRLTIDMLTVYYLSAGEDAAKTAMSFGFSSLAAGTILPILENNFRIRKKDVRTAVSFTEKESYIYVKAHVSIAMRIIPYILIIFGYRYKQMKSSEK